MRLMIGPLAEKLFRPSSTPSGTTYGRCDNQCQTRDLEEQNDDADQAGIKMEDEQQSPFEAFDK